MIGNKGSTLSLRELLSGKDADFDKAMTDGKVQLMRLKNIAITIDGQVHKDKNLFDLFLDHQNDGMFEDYVREHTPVNANLLIQADYVIAFVADGKHSRFAGVYQVLGEDKRIKVLSEDPKKKYEEKIFLKVLRLRAFEPLGGRVLVDWGGMAAQRWLQWFRGDKIVLRIDEGIIRMMIPFTSYNDVLLSFKELKNLIETDNVEWRDKLKAVNGIYGIADQSNGKLYVGSAYGYEGIWGRWKVYAETNGHGNNDMLVELLSKNKDYAWDHFQWFILETFPLNVTDDYAIQRENLYKLKFCTRLFGYNKN
jgi:hypothetical protein